MGKQFQEAGHGTGACALCSSEASSPGQNQTHSTKGVLSLFRRKGKGGSQCVVQVVCASGYVAGSSLNVTKPLFPLHPGLGKTRDTKSSGKWFYALPY